MDEQQTGAGERRPFENFGRRIDERVSGAAPKVEEEFRRVITYVNDRLVPQLRQESSQVLHSAAEQLRRLAEHLESGRPSER